MTHFKKPLTLGLLVLAALWSSNFAYSRDWETLKSCKLLNNGSNDGDSFHVQHEGKEYIFRLYFVDCPEVENRFPDRVKEQGSYFKLDENETIKLGKEAEAFTKTFLSGSPFTVYTCWEDARGDSSLPRNYAFIEKDSKSLIEALTAAGYVRIYGMTKLDSGNPLNIQPNTYLSKLKGLEAQAQHSHLGGWSKSTINSVEVAEPVHASTPTPVAPEPPVPVTPALPSSTVPTININTATANQLQEIPFVGPTMAQKIIAGRPYKEVQDLKRVQGMSPADLEIIAPQLRTKD